MKRLFKITLFAAAAFTAAQVKAQDHRTVGESVKHDAKVVGHKTSELAAKGAAAVADKRYENHWGPRGENVYIDSHSRYYCVNKLGHRVYFSKSQLRDKPLR